MRTFKSFSQLKKEYKFILSFIFLIILIPNNDIQAQNWSALGTGCNARTRALAVYNGQLIVGGDFTTAGGVSANHIAAWNGTTWTSLGSPTNGVNGSVYALYVFNNNLYAGGIFTTAGGKPCLRIAKWNGTTWDSLGHGANDTVFTINSFNSEIIAGGAFTSAGNISCNKIASWNGTIWHIIGSGTILNGVNNAVLCLDKYNGELVAGGRFTSASGTPTNRIAKWSGTVWSAVGTGVDNGQVAVLYQYSNVLIVGGSYSTINGVAFGHIAQWNGTSYTGMNGGVNGAGLVNSIRPFNGILFVGGDFPNAGTTVCNNIASWNGTAWATLQGGLESGGSMVDAITLYHGLITAAGSYTTTNNGLVVNYVAAWGAAPTGIATLIAPPNGSTIYTHNPQMKWTTVYWAGKYNIQISTNPAFSSMVLNDSTAQDIDTTYNVPNGILQNNTLYYWRIAAVNPRGRGPFTAAWSFTVGNVPAAPVLLTPPDSSTVPTVTPTLTWTNVPTTDYYGVQVSFSPTFASYVVNDSNVSATNYTINPGTLVFGTQYYWRVFARNGLGRGPNSTTWKFTPINITGLTNNGSEIPNEYNLFQNFPNPFNPTTMIKFDIPANSNVKLTVYDVQGRESVSLVNEELSAGRYQVSWNASNLSSGVYYYKLESGNKVFTKKLILLK